jgi:AcrR family transcriptional regulator
MFDRMRERARSAEDKTRRADDLLAAAEAVALELGGVRHVTLAAVTERAGLHRTGVRRYYASKEELLLELAQRSWSQWRDVVTAGVDGRTGLGPTETATVISRSLVALPVFCDLLTHASLHLEGDVDMERARQYKANAFALTDEIVAALATASTMTAGQIANLLPAGLALAASFWQTAHPTASLAALYEQEPRWGHTALEFEPRLTLLLNAVATGLAAQVSR